MKIDLTTGDIRHHIKEIAIPSSIGFFFNTMFNVVDTYFGGQISTDALAALSLTFPVYMMILALSFGVGTAAATLTGNALGAKNEQAVKLYTAQSLSLGFFASLTLTVIGLYASESLFTFLGAKGAYLGAAIEYMEVLYYFIFSFTLVQTANSLLSAHGDTKQYRNYLILSFFLNVILDPILMYGLYGAPKLGFRGIALATALLQVLGCVYLCRSLIKLGVINRETPKKMIPNIKHYLTILHHAVPASLNMMTVALGFFVSTYYVSRFGQVAVAAFGVGTRIEQIILLPAIGLNVAVISLVSQNNGANKPERIRESFHYAIRYGAKLMAVGGLLTIIFAKSLMGFFTDDLEVINIGAYFISIEALIFSAYCTLYISTSALQGLKLPMFAVWIGTIRQIILPFAAMYILIDILGYGLSSVWYSRFVATGAAAVFTLWYAQRVINKLNYQ